VVSRGGSLQGRTVVNVYKEINACAQEAASENVPWTMSFSTCCRDLLARRLTKLMRLSGLGQSVIV